MKKSILIFSYLLSMFVLSGCYDRRELEERISVIAVSIDKVDEETGTNKYSVSVQIPIPNKITGGTGTGGGAENAVKTMSASGETVAAAFTNIQKRLNQQLFMGHTRIIAISEEIAKDGISDILDGFRRDPSIRRLLWFLVVEGKARSLLEANPKLEQIPTVFIMSLIENGAKTERIPEITLGQFYLLSSNVALQPMTNYVQASSEDILWKGVALFKKEVMLGTLSDEESWILGQLRNEQSGGEILIYPEKNSNDKTMLIRPKQLDTSVDVKVKDGKVKAHFDVYIQANIIEKNFDTDLSDSKNLESLERETEKDLEEKAVNVIKLLQDDYKVDALRLGSKIKAFHYRDWKKLDWHEQDFQKADISVSYKVKFRRTGMQMN